MPDRDLNAMLRRLAANQPDLVAFRTPERTWTFAQVFETACRIGNALRAEGIGPGDRVACLTRLLAMPVPCEESRATAAGNTWDVRVATAIEAIDRLEREKGGTGQRDCARSLVRKRRPVQTGSWATVESLRGGSPQ